jgi:hypothetical protein
MSATRREQCPRLAVRAQKSFRRMRSSDYPLSALLSPERTDFVRAGTASNQTLHQGENTSPAVL